ncbi:hypothetical protein GSI_10045 [Ganoderma sinense ZZ0214-1]|uniref:Uncharacterized protein n=1 Tax=Ganoderma sinense ZZ0214-1 TaxID=1077348 RepID=A0A2G8RZJ5_9APHY|nr:hypothetical protein GSI_10045 [Ganoderma sinense ZZ0214-1]
MSSLADSSPIPVIPLNPSGRRDELGDLPRTSTTDAEEDGYSVKGKSASMRPDTLVEVNFKYLLQLELEIAELKAKVTRQNEEISRLFGLVHLNRDIWTFYWRNSKEWEELLWPYLDPASRRAHFPYSHPDGERDA